MTTGFLYFCEGTSTRPTEDQLEPVAYAFGGVNGSLKVRPAMTGPGNRAGVLFWEGGDDEVRGFEPESQTWRRVGGGLYVGHDDGGALPGPADLQRERMLPGHEVELGDGRRWVVPVARQWVIEDGELRWQLALPTEPRLGEDGQWEPGDVDRDYRAYWDDSCRWWDAKIAAGAEPAESDDEPVTVTFADGIAQALRALQLNYRIGAAEAEALGLFRRDRAIDVLDASIDWPGVLALSASMEKKSEARPVPAT